MNGNLTRALRKLKHSDGREWGGYLTPCEVQSLIASGATPTSPFDIDELHNRIARGRSNPRWHYFALPDPLRVMVLGAQA